MENSGGATSKEGPPAHNMPCQPLRNIQAGIHLGWEMHIPLGRTLSQTRDGHKQVEGTETTWKTNLIAIKPGRVTCKDVLRGSLRLLHSARVPLPNEVLCFASACVSSGNFFSEC